jgi:hypothetical protein
MPRFLEKMNTNPAGVVAGCGQWLPYNLRDTDFVRMVEDVHGMLHEVNVKLNALGYDRLEELLDPAGFSGLISRSVVDRLASASKSSSLTPNRYHNGYPDLLPRGMYAGDAVAHGGAGGLEVKASRYESGWQAHGPRSGWFCVVPFELDHNDNVALHDREPTKLRAVLVAELAEQDWSWQPAKEGKIRSGTASVRPSGEAKLRRGAVWIDPEYNVVHQERCLQARLSAITKEALDALVLRVVTTNGPLTAAEAAEATANELEAPVAAVANRTTESLRRMTREERLVKPTRSTFAAVPLL